jgi:hypothetical protein
MPNTAATYPGSTAGGSVDAGTGENDDAWVNPGNVSADDATEAQITAATFDSPDISRRLQAYNFAFSGLDPAATVDGIIVEIDRRSIISGSGKDFRVQLASDCNNTTSTPTFLGNNKADTATTWPTTSTVATYGTSTDLWGTTGLTGADITSSNFGICFSASALIANADIGCDFIRMTIYYTPPPAPPDIPLIMARTRV